MDMVNLGIAQLTGLVMLIGLVAIASTNLAFADKQPCGVQRDVHSIGCMPLEQAHLVVVGLVIGIIALAIGLGIAEKNLHSFPKLT